MRILAALVALASFFACTFEAHANAVSGSIGFEIASLAQADASPTGNINTATRFDLVGLSTTLNESGVFASLPLQSFSPVSFKPSVGNSLSIDNLIFGDFDSSSVSIKNSMPGFLDVFVKGTFTAGPGEGALAGKTFPTTMRLAFTQTPPKTGEISASGTMEITGSVVPELPTAVLFLSGLVGFVVARKRGHFVID